jgi:hypothetical protein
MGKFALIDDGGLQVIPKVGRSIEINSFESCNNYVLDLEPKESVSLADDTDYDLQNSTMDV